MPKYLQQAAMEGEDLGGEDQGGETSESGKWPDNWREIYAGSDEDKMSRLSRYATPDAAFDGLFAAQQKIRSGELKAPFPTEGTDEEKSAWRADNGLPESSDKYDLNFEDGFVIGDDDKPFVDEYLKSAFETNQTPAQVKQNLQWYFQTQEKQAELQEEKDLQVRADTQDHLRSEWGQEYRRNINLINGLLETFPEEAKEGLMNGRMADGTPIFSHPDIMKGLVKLALEVNPTATLVPATVGNKAQNVNDRIGEIEKMMRENRKAYNADEKVQKEYRDLLTLRDKLSK